MEAHWSAKNAKGKSYEALLADPALAPHVENLFPLSGLMSSAGRTRTRTLGEGTYGRVNLETIPGGRGRVAVKYSKDPDATSETVVELAVLKCLKGYPHVAQWIETVDRNASGTRVPTPSLLMGYAPHDLTKRVLYTSWDDLLHTVIGVLQGYNTLHSLGIVHRDTKPGNMLMTARKEVWITDFGMARYSPSTIPPCQDGYTGTTVFASPEILMKQILQTRGRSTAYTYEGWRAHDAWAVGSSLYNILTDQYLFSGNDVEEIVQRVYNVKGVPVAADGEIHELHTRLLGLFTDPGATIGITERIVARTVFKPSAGRSGELTAVAQVVEGLLTYNPATRLSIQGAIDQLVAAGLMRAEAPLPKPTLLSRYSDAAFSSVLDAAMIRILFGWLDSVCETTAISISSRHVVFDRTCLYTRMILNALGETVTRGTLQAYGMLAMGIASELFDESGSGISLRNMRILTARAYTVPQLQECLNRILMLPIDYLGETHYDRMMASATTDAHRERAAAINKLCFLNSIYQEFASSRTPEQIMAVLESMMKSETAITVETIRLAFTEPAAVPNESEMGRELNRLRLLQGNYSVLSPNETEANRVNVNTEAKRELNRLRLLQGNYSVLRPENHGGGTRRKRSRRRATRRLR